MTENTQAKRLQETLRALQGPSQPNLFSQAADELDRLSAFEIAFFSLLELVRHYAKVTGEMDSALRKKACHADDA